MSKKWVGRWVKWVSHKKHWGKGGTHRGLMGDAGVNWDRAGNNRIVLSVDSKLPKSTDERRQGWGEGKNGNESGVEGGKFPLGMDGKWGDISVGNKRLI